MTRTLARTAPRKTIVAFVAATMVTVLFGAAAVVAFRTPSRSARFDGVRYRDSVGFDYAVHTQPSVLYPNNVVGPVLPPAGAKATSRNVAPPQAIYRTLARSVDLGVAYALDTQAEGALQGTYRADLAIAVDNGWHTQSPLVAPTSFDGNSVRFRTTIAFDDIDAFLAKVEAETGARVTQYTLTVLPTFELTGTLAGRSIDTAYAPPFTLKVDGTQIQPDQKLRREQAGSTGTTVAVARSTRALGVALPVDTARAAAGAGCALALLLVAWFAAVAFLGVGLAEPVRIGTRYRSLLVDVVHGTSVPPVTRTVRVPSMAELARLAMSDGGVVFHEAPAATERSRQAVHRYFVTKDAATYEYRAEP